ncbi:MAG: GGDEF domain-containing protein [Candidatus Caldatribacteriaceae bacterium]
MIGGEGGKKQKIVLLGGDILDKGLFVAGVQQKENMVFFSQDSGWPSFLVIPLFVAEKLEGLFLFESQRNAFTERDIQRAQIVKETLELLLFRKKTEAELLYLSTHDSLTGALNHKAFTEKGEDALVLAERYQRPLSLVFLDLDGFKSVNDRFGHLFGDKVLFLFVQHLHAHLRRSDLLARLGGDEFVVLLPETTRKGALELLERLENDPLWLEKGDEIIVLRFSAGVSVYPEDGKTLEVLLEVADQRMYEKKRLKKI